MDDAARVSLRDSLLQLLASSRTAPKQITVQLCLSLSGLAIQLDQWENPVKDMVDMFGKDPAMLGPLLEFLKVLPEELVLRTTKIPITVRQSLI